MTLLAVLAAVYGARPAGSAVTPRTVAQAARDGEPARSPRAGLHAAVAIALVAVLCALVVWGAAAFSSAAFTSSTTNPLNTFSTSGDWAPPTVSMLSPGIPVKATITVTASASDAESGIRDVVIQYLPADGSAWTALCTATAAPYSCGWNTATLTDGSYSLRALATDNAGHSTASATVDTVVANNLLVVLTDPGGVQHGTVNLATTLYSPGTITYTVRVEYSLAGANQWNKTICSNLSSPYNCTWNTAGFANDYYDLRSVAVSGGTTTYSAVITDVLVDNLAPTITMNDPGTPLSGTRTFTAAASDAHSGVAQVLIQYLRSGTSTWNTVCTVATAPYSCLFDTTTLANNTYSLRAIATDAAGNSTTSATVANRVIDNTVSSVSVVDPGNYLTGTVPLNAAANSSAGVSNVKIQAAPAGTTAWTTKCTLTVAPYTCNWDSTTVADGLYDFRAVLTDGNAVQTVSSTIASRRVDNSPLRGTDIQTVNGSSTAGKLQTGDSISYTYSQQVNPATVSPGWTGTPLAVTLRLRDGNLLGPGSTVNLGPVNLQQDYAKPGRTAIFNATMTAATVTVNGVPITIITVTLGSIASGANSLHTVTAASTIRRHDSGFWDEEEAERERWNQRGRQL